MYCITLLQKYKIPQSTLEAPYHVPLKVKSLNDDNDDGGDVDDDDDENKDDDDSNCDVW